MALAGMFLSELIGVRELLIPLAVILALVIVAALLIREDHEPGRQTLVHSRERKTISESRGLRDATLRVFVVAMVLFHLCNAPAGVYLGLFLKQDLDSPNGLLPAAFVVSMVAWMLVVRPAGVLADRMGRRPLLIAAWTIMAVRLALLAIAQAAWQVLMIQILDGLGQALFAVLAAAWVTDRLGSLRRAGAAQVIVGSSLVFG